MLGASCDKPEFHQAWTARRGVKISMIHDRGCAVAKGFGVAGKLGGIKHGTFLIDEDGTIRKAFTRVKAKGHAAAVLQECRALWGASGSSNADMGGG